MGWALRPCVCDPRAGMSPKSCLGCTKCFLFLLNLFFFVSGAGGGLGGRGEMGYTGLEGDLGGRGREGEVELRRAGGRCGT